MKTSRIISIIGLIVFAIIAIDQFQLFTIHESIVGLTNIVATLYTLYVVILYTILLINTIIFRIGLKGSVDGLINVSDLSLSKIDTVFKNNSIIGKIITYSTALLAIVTFHYTLPIVLLFGFFIMRYFKVVYRQLIDTVEKAREEKE
ncbi:MAG: hypothetical protein GY804_03660 [Alphaproteobacteria bacterium]|nr:hypothetical protein [Alphaproteobacteria bacterium]